MKRVKYFSSESSGLHFEFILKCFFTALQNTWDGCKDCQTSKQVNHNHRGSKEAAVT